MIELLAVVCLYAEPAKCKEVSLVYMAEAVTPMQCMLGSQPELAKWADHNPRWFLKKWKCQPAGRVAKI
jgi:hypothetical protein